VKPLSERERRFVEAYMGEAAGNATVAAVSAGYSKKTAGSIASRLLKKVNIRQAIDDRAKTDPSTATREERQRFWTDVMLGKGPYNDTAMRDRLKASELLGKSQADFVELHEHTGKDGKPIETKVTFGGRYRKADGERG
jgi:phage terminase small subunit